MKNVYVLIATALIVLAQATPIIAKNENGNQGKSESKTQQSQTVQEDSEPDSNEDEAEDVDQESEPDFEFKSNQGTSKQLPINANTTKVELKQQGNSITVKTTNKFGTEQETEIEDDENEDEEGDSEDEDILETESASESGKFKIKVKEKGVGFFIEQGKFTAKTNYPLSINSDTNELIITTPAGTKVVTILPDQAIANMLRRGVLDVFEASDSATPDDDSDDATDSAEPSPTPEATSSGITQTSDDSIILTVDDDGNLVYQLMGKKNKKFLGIFPVQVKKQVTISAETGEVLTDAPQGFINRVLNLLSTQTN